MSRFDDFLSQLKTTNFKLKDYVDFLKVNRNVEIVKARLQALNYLLGKQDLKEAVIKLWEDNPAVFSVLSILIALRDDKMKKEVVLEDGNIKLVADLFCSVDDILLFLRETNLYSFFANHQVDNLVDYVFGVEVGLDTHARKNRSGNIMQRRVSDIFTANDIAFSEQVDLKKKYPQFIDVFGETNKKLDFVIETSEITYLIEVNNYSSNSGSKLNDTAKSFVNISRMINDVEGFQFVWITEGLAWRSAQNDLAYAIDNIKHIYNLTNIVEFIDIVKGNGQ